MTDDILEQIKAYRPPKKLHPIAEKTYLLYDTGGFKLSDEALDTIRAELQGYRGDLKALTDALCGLSAFIMYAMETLNDPIAAEQVAGLIKECRPAYEGLGQFLEKAFQEAARKATSVLDRFMDRDTSAKARAPKYDEPPEEGTVPLRVLKPVAQPPPVRNKGKKP